MPTDSSSSILSRQRREVVYRHHSRDSDGDVVLFFVNLSEPENLLKSSPVLAVERTYAAIFDAKGYGDLTSVVIITRQTVYNTTMPLRLFEHLEIELDIKEKLAIARV